MGSDEIKFSPISPRKRKLNSGFECPLMGLSTDRLVYEMEEDINFKEKKKQEIKDEKEKQKIENEILKIKENAENVIYQSIVDGTRLIETSKETEEIVGKGVKKALDRGIVRRQELFIVAKLELEDKKNPEEAIYNSLNRLQLGYLDLYLDHWPSCINYKEKKGEEERRKELIPANETWEKMQKLVREGKTNSIGVCNYNIANLLNIIPPKPEPNYIKPAVIEVEFHPYLFQKDLKHFCELEDIAIFAYNPLTKGKYKNKIDPLACYFDIFRDGQLTYLMEKYANDKDFKNKNVTRAQIILSWHMCSNIIPIIGTTKPDRMKENLKAMEFSLDEKTVKLLSSFEDRKHRFCDGSEIFGIDIFGL